MCIKLAEGTVRPVRLGGELCEEVHKVKQAVFAALEYERRYTFFGGIIFAARAFWKLTGQTFNKPQEDRQ